jgi:hypothetical protein
MPCPQIPVLVLLALAGVPTLAHGQEAPPATPPAEEPAASPPDAAGEPEVPADPPPVEDDSGTTDTASPPVDPSAPLERFRKGRWGRGAGTDDEDGPRTPSTEVPVEVTRPPSDGAPSSGKGIRLQLRNGTSVEGEVVAETAEGWALKLPDGETRFFDKLDVVSDNAPREPKVSVAQKALLAISLVFPGAGQIVYGAMVQKGQPWERSAMVVGVILGAISVLGFAVLGIGVVAGLALTSVPMGNVVFVAGPLNPISLAGGVALCLAMAVGLLDAGARVVLD